MESILKTTTKYNITLNKTDWLIITIFFSCYAVLLTIGFVEDHPIKNVCVYFISSAIFSILTILSMINFIIPKFIVEKKQLFLFTLSTILVFTLFGMCDYLMNFFGGHKWSEFPSLINLFLNSVFRLTETAGLILGVLLTKKHYESIMVINEIEKARKDNELKLLRSQLNPHFLFNNLNSLNALIDTDTELAKEYTDRLSKIYRYLIKTKDNDIIELQKEIDFAENYIFLVKTRFDKSYHFVLKNKLTDINNKFIPTSALQTLLENVIKHNKSTLKTTVYVVITITNDTITVYNTKTHLNSDTISFGIGLENLQKRYSNLTNKTLIIDDDKDYFSATIPVIKLLNR